MTDWHVVVSRFGQENRCVDELLPLADEVCSPLREEKRYLRGREIVKQIPWLGSLTLARWATDDPYIWHVVNDLPSVRGILGGWPPAVVSGDQVERLLSNIQIIVNKGQITEMSPCAPGDLVRFTWLAFFRVVGLCVWSFNGFVGLRLPLLGRETTLSVPWGCVEQIDKAVPSYRVSQLGRRKNGRVNNFALHVS